QLLRLMIFGWVTPAAAGSNSGDLPGSMVTSCRPLGLVLFSESTRTWAASDLPTQRGSVPARPSCTGCGSICKSVQSDHLPPERQRTSTRASLASSDRPESHVTPSMENCLRSFSGSFETTYPLFSSAGPLWLLFLPFWDGSPSGIDLRGLTSSCPESTDGTSFFLTVAGVPSVSRVASELLNASNAPTSASTNTTGVSFKAVRQESMGEVQSCRFTFHLLVTRRQLEPISTTLATRVTSPAELHSCSPAAWAIRAHAGQKWHYGSGA